MRRKKNLVSRMQACSELLAHSPELLCGRWRELTGASEVFLEIGCGKGRFVTELAGRNPAALCVAVERVQNVLVLALERAKAANLRNIRFLDLDAARLGAVMSAGEVTRLYLNFSDPWPARRHEKRRLTHEAMLGLYARLLAPNGEIHFKTDNLPFFEYSLGAFRQQGFDVVELSRDLHATPSDNIVTEYESLFAARGVKINRCVARKTAKTRISPL